MRVPLVFAGGVVFGFGLALSGMTRPEVVLSFLQLDDLGLMLVMGGAIAVTSLAFHLAPRLLARPLTGVFEERKNRLSPAMVVGAVLFGVGWGIAGICPGAMIASLGTGNWPILLGILGTFVGAYLQGRFAPEA